LSCPQNAQYIRVAENSEGLEKIGREALEDVTGSFQGSVEYGVATSELSNVRSAMDQTHLFISNPITSGGRFIEGNKRFYVLSNEEWISNSHLGIVPMYTGAYHYNSASILLHSNKDAPFSWCRNILIHETLHSVSIYSRIWNKPPGIIPKHRMLAEGLTECLTGYIILKKHPECYEIYKANVQGACGIAYRQTTKLFCTLAQFIGIVPLANFYLAKEKEFKSPWVRFLEEIHSAGFTKFSFQLDDQKSFRESAFRDECVKSIAGFKKIYNSLVLSLDFSKIQ
jgi:hypothetical protein